MKYTGQDVRNAELALDTDEDADVQKMNPLQYLCMICNDEEEGELMYHNYLKGKEVLKTAQIVNGNDRYDITNKTAYDKSAKKMIERGVDSPVVEFLWGYVGTSQMAGVMALKEREG